MLLVSTGTCADRRGKVKELADQIMRSIMAQPAVLEPHIGALIDWCIDFTSHLQRNPHRYGYAEVTRKSYGYVYAEVAGKINLLQHCFSSSPPQRLQSTLQSL